MNLLTQSSQYANLLIPFCEAASINYRNTDATLKKRIIVSFTTFIEPETLHEILFPGDHFDWKNTKEYLQDVQYSTSDWIQFISLMDFSNEIISNQQMQEMISSALAGIKLSTMGKAMTPVESMKLCFAKGGISPSWDAICKALILCNISDIDLQQVFQFLLVSAPSTETSTIHDIIRHTSTICKHSPREYHDIFRYIFQKDNCHVRSHILLRSLDARNEAIEKKKTSQLSIINQSRKPSLSQILLMNSLKQASQAQQKTNGLNPNSNDMEADTFVKFCEMARLSSNISVHVKRTAYYMKCLPSTSITQDKLYENLSLLLGNESASLPVISSIEIVNPDVQALKTFVSEVFYSGAPSVSLKTFHQHCMSSTNVKGMNWTIVFRLYLSIFCRQDIAKELWMDVLSKTAGATQQTMQVKFSSLVSTENEKNIQCFLQEYPINTTEIMLILLKNIAIE